MGKRINVTEPYLPPLEEFIPYLQKIWDSKVLTNNGPFHQQLESELCRYLGVEHISLFANGTLALVTALQALRIKGEVITTPYSFVATAHSLLWNNIEPVFVDIDQTTCNITAENIEKAITPRTTAILPVHCYGTPCDVVGIQDVADSYGLKVIYDAAHAFGVRLGKESILKFGDLSVLSFHATKVFNTFEGGAIISPDKATKERIDFLKNFGFADEVTVTAPGINGKMSEINAAFGLLQLQHIDSAIGRRREIDRIYRNLLAPVRGIRLLENSMAAERNASYFPILVDDAYPLSRDALYEKMKETGFFGRRYFFPLISDMPMYRVLPSSSPSNLPIAADISSKVLCLPIYPALQDSEVERLVELIASN